MLILVQILSPLRLGEIASRSPRATGLWTIAAGLTGIANMPFQKPQRNSKCNPRFFNLLLGHARLSRKTWFWKDSQFHLGLRVADCARTIPWIIFPVVSSTVTYAQTFHPAEDFGVRMYPRQVHNLVFALSTFIIPHFNHWIEYTQQDGTVSLVEGCCPFTPIYSIAIY